MYVRTSCVGTFTCAHTCISFSAHAFGSSCWGVAYVSLRALHFCLAAAQLPRDWETVHAEAAERRPS